MTAVTHDDAGLSWGLAFSECLVVYIPLPALPGAEVGEKIFKVVDNTRAFLFCFFFLNCIYGDGFPSPPLPPPCFSPPLSFSFYSKLILEADNAVY